MNALETMFGVVRSPRVRETIVSILKEHAAYLASARYDAVFRDTVDDEFQHFIDAFVLQRDGGGVRQQYAREREAVVGADRGGLAGSGGSDMNIELERAFNAHMRLAQFGADQWERRRSYEWKVTLGFWALLAGAIALKERFPMPEWLAGAGIIAIPTFYVLFWLYPVWRSNDRDARLSVANLRRALSLLNAAEGAHEDRARGFLSDWSMIFQAAVTFFLVIALAFLRVIES